MRLRVTNAISIAVALCLVRPSLGQQPAPDLVLFNGKIFTCSSARPYAEALAVRGERIVAVGGSREVLALADQASRRIDLAGRTVIPGINDAHLHMAVEPKHYDLALNGTDPAWPEIIDALAAATGRVRKGTWITGVFGPSLFDDPHATRTALDATAPDHLVALWDWTGHAVLLNTPAMRSLNVGEDEQNPQAGVYVRNARNGPLTGMALEYAKFRVDRKYMRLVSDEDAISQIHEFFTQTARWGITTVQDMASVIPPDRLMTWFERAPPEVRVRVIWFGLTDEHGRLINQGHASNTRSLPLVSVSGTKWILDGTPIERSAAMRQPYADGSSTSGELNFSEAEMEQMLLESIKARIN